MQLGVGVGHLLVPGRQQLAAGEHDIRLRDLAAKELHRETHRHGSVAAVAASRRRRRRCGRPAPRILDSWRLSRHSNHAPGGSSGAARGPRPRAAAARRPVRRVLRRARAAQRGHRAARRRARRPGPAGAGRRQRRLAGARLGQPAAGEQGRRDYRLSLPFVDDPRRLGHDGGGLVDAIELTSGGRLAAIPYAGPWTAQTLGGLFDVAAALAHPVTLVANLATRYLWGGRPRPDQLLDYLLDGEQSGPPPDWDVGHFACVIGRAAGPGGRLYVRGRHVPLARQRRRAPAAAGAPGARARAPDMPPGGMIVVVARAGCRRGARGRRGARPRGGAWDNGTVTQATLR